MPACTKRVHIFSISGSTILEVGSAGNTKDYFTTISVVSDVTPPGTFTIPNSASANKLVQFPLPPKGNGTAIRFLTTFKSAATTTVTLNAKVAGPGGQVLLSCDVSGKKGDIADMRIVFIQST